MRGSLRAAAAAFAGGLALFVPGTSAAQVIQPFVALPPPETPARSTFFPRFSGRLAMEALATDDDQFSWDGDFGGGIDIVDAGGWRGSAFFNLEVIFGRELQRFDPNQGNYTIELQAARRTGPGEVSGFFHHQSRHLSDRPKDFPIAWNAVGAQYVASTRSGAWDAGAHGRAAWVTSRAFVDYEMIWSGGASVGYTAHPRVRLTVRGGLAGVRVEPELFGRNGQVGGRIEAGMELIGDGAVVEVFGAYERRIDASALDPGVRRWALVGLRVTSPTRGAAPSSGVP